MLSALPSIPAASPAASGFLSPSQVVALQRLVGNRAVVSLLATGDPVMDDIPRHVSAGMPGASRAALSRKPSKVVESTGTFDAEYYDALETAEEGDKIGAAMVLTFTPTEQVTGRVGLVQTIAQERQVVASSQEPTVSPMKVDTDVVQKQLTSEDKWEPAIVTDSPVYYGLRDPSAPLPAAPRTLEQASDPAKTAQKWTTPAHGSVSAAKRAESQAYMASGVAKHGKLSPKYATGEGFGASDKAIPAALTDIPGFAASTPLAKTTKVAWRAEVVALGLSGPATGKYLGSVRWGWRYEPPASGARPAVLDPTELQAGGKEPSTEFKTAAFDWNTQAVVDPASGKKVDLIQLPLTAEEMSAPALAKVRDWFVTGGSQNLWRKVEELLDTHAKRASDVLAESEVALLSTIAAVLRGREAHWDGQLTKPLFDQKNRERNPEGAATKKWDQFVELKAKDGELRARTQALLGQVRTAGS